MPPSEEYAPIVRGPLKLKGSGPSGIQKKKKKKKKPINHDQESPNHNENLSAPLGQSKTLADDGDRIHNEDESAASSLTKKDAFQQDNESIDQDRAAGKTASEQAFEEMRKKRLMDRLAKEGLKTHKQRVEELNKYLSNLSEHHDM
ncbi:hypothetical protein EPUL_002094 [Erysiphe pulchra]|uniref:DUF1754-domain-containing protein n=1 Tax=Erysiphe pulchra TaxID=225359 RepID=A0A2S4PX32_9PEZI|nr:hypothetical protein EPUL_002094 [Erysiphe pulchra]